MLDLLPLAQELIGLDSVSRNSNSAVAAVLEEALRLIGADVERLTYDDGGIEKVSLVGCIGEGEGGLALCGHMDTVPAVGWIDDPLRPVVRDGRLYGLGACDMKGSLAAMICAAARYHPGNGDRPLTLIFTSDEETTKAGARLVAGRSSLLATIRPGQAVIGEPTGLRVVNAHRSDITFACRAEGVAAHSATGMGRNANLAMIPFLNEMVGIYHRLRTTELHDPRYIPPFADWNIVVDNHGCPPNMTVPLSTATIKFRYTPSMDPAPFVEAVRNAACRHGVAVDVHKGGEPLDTPRDAEIVRIALALAGQEAPDAMSYGTDATVLGKLFPCIIFGPGSFACAHTPEESVAIDELERAVELYSLLISHFCSEG